MWRFGLSDDKISWSITPTTEMERLILDACENLNKNSDKVQELIEKSWQVYSENLVKAQEQWKTIEASENARIDGWIDSLYENKDLEEIKKICLMLDYLVIALIVFYQIRK